MVGNQKWEYPEHLKFFQGQQHTALATRAQGGWIVDHFDHHNTFYELPECRLAPVLIKVILARS